MCSLQTNRIDNKGQSLVETALVTPLFLFMILGILQMGMVYHASYLVKYAAYRAARTGALLHANHDAMREAAFAVLVPVLSVGATIYIPSDNPDKALLDSLKLDPAALYAIRYNLIKQAEKNFTLLKTKDLLRVIICGPTQQHLTKGSSYKIKNKELDFDDADNYIWTGNYWAGLSSFERTKLRVQVQLFFHMKIPLANSIIYKIWRGQRLIKEMRMGSGGGLFNTPGKSTTTGSNDVGRNHRHMLSSSDSSFLNNASDLGTYLMPIHDNYPFRMQSPLYPNTEGYKLPNNNQCWHYQDGNEGAL